MGPGAKLIPKLLLQVVAMLAVFAVAIFGAAGTWDWPSGWAFLALFAATSMVISLWLAAIDPGLLAERMRSPVQRGQKPWDRVFLLGMVVGYFAWLVLMAWDARRMSWSHIPLWAQVFGGLLIVASYFGIAWVFRTNSFAAPVIKIDAERKQTVVTTGPYAFVRHPMYAFALPQFIGCPLVLGSWWGLTGGVAITLAVTWRALGEEKMLKAELAGYEDYARRVRWRFLPGVW
ncbi:isoprenylcysteine carboxylmethyltransferase family protein [Phenylobacterium sp.]|jgi:protein-S-isoprenylcysteine O-methyltransferase Ste14|uniref:methyltransferase family protein n=1 Tax=Phenylobacterium sp. TaxID=1871053 RepID=UPI0025F71E25|nr:isoprenylcysteine carboxylmethyltransferase family protein [Phenylobacterium sp.]